MKNVWRSILGCVAAIPGLAAAQYQSYGVSFSNPVTAQMNTDVNSGLGSRLIYRMILKKHGYTDATLKDMSTEEMNRRIETGDYGEPKQVQAAIVPTSPASRFRSTGTRIFMNDFLAALTPKKEYQEALREVFDAGFKAFEADAKKEGMENDLAAAMAYFIGSAYLVAKEGQAPDDGGLVLIARAIQIQYNNEQFRKIKDADKQKFYELMVSLGTYLVATYRTALDTKDDELKNTITTAAKSTLKGYLKIDPDKLRITPRGLEVVK